MSDNFMKTKLWMKWYCCRRYICSINIFFLSTTLYSWSKYIYDLMEYLLWFHKTFRWDFLLTYIIICFCLLGYIVTRKSMLNQFALSLVQCNCQIIARKACALECKHMCNLRRTMCLTTKQPSPLESSWECFWSAGFHSSASISLRLSAKLAYQVFSVPRWDSSGINLFALNLHHC